MYHISPTKLDQSPLYIWYFFQKILPLVTVNSYPCLAEPLRSLYCSSDSALVINVSFYLGYWKFSSELVDSYCPRNIVQRTSIFSNTPPLVVSPNPSFSMHPRSLSKLSVWGNYLFYKKISCIDNLSHSGRDASYKLPKSCKI